MNPLDKHNLGWKRVDKYQSKSGDSRFEQRLANGVVNEYESMEIKGKIHYAINGQLLKHGDGIVVGADGKLQVITQKHLQTYVQERGITDANVTVNGKNNNGLDAVLMAQATALVVNDHADKLGRTIAQIHIFNDKDSPDSSLRTLNRADVQKSLEMLVKAGAFSTGGSIIGHSEGAYSVSAAIMELGDDQAIKASVYTFGGAHPAAYPDRVNGWRDFYNPGDLAIYAAQLFNRDYKVTAMKPSIIRDNPNSKSLYQHNINGLNGIRWYSDGHHSSFGHLYVNNYMHAIQRYYHYNSGK